MRFKTIALGSSSIAMIAISLPANAAMAVAQTQAAQPPEPGVDPNRDPDAAQEDDQPPPESDGIVVTGIRQSIQSAQAIKRNSDQIVDAIVAEDIGKLPDITASASLARITGVQVTRAAGEAADVQVRGLPDLSTTYNGREIFTAENRGVALQDFPAGGVAALEVYKASTANLVEGGIAGQINVRSRRPFDFDGLEIFGSAAGVHTEQAQKFGLNANLLFSDRWETGIGEIGILINGSYAETKFLDSTREQSFFIARANPDQTSTPGFRYPDASATFLGQGDRSRPSVNGAIQWRPTPELEVSFDALFQGYRAHDTSRFLFVPLFGPAQFTDIVTEGNEAVSLTATGANAPDGFTGFIDARTDTYQYAGNVKWTGQRLTASADLAFTDSTFTSQQENVDYVYASSPVRDVVFDLAGDEGGPTFGFRDFDVTAPRNYIFRGLFERALEAKGNDLQARLDLSYDLDLGFLSRLQAGARYTDRDASRRSGGRYSPQAQRGIRYGDAILPLEFELGDPGFGFDDSQRIRRWIVPTRDSVFGNIEALRSLVGFPEGPPPFLDQEAFSATEKSYAGYIQAKYAFDAGFPIDGVIGVRVVKTDGSVTGTSRLVGPATPGGPDVITFEPVTRGQDYTDYLPNASFRMEFTPELQLRGAYTETRTRPRFDQLNPSANINPPPAICQTDPTSINCFRTGGGGNPNLRPLVSTNYDLSLEYYFAAAGSASLALFRRDVNGFIANATVETLDPEFGRLQLNAPDNGGDGRLQGVEASFTGFLDFDWVPQWGRAFGLQANYTYIDGKAELAPSLVNSPAGNLRPGRQPIPGVSQHSFNLIGIYEIPEFSARLAYNRRSGYVESYLRLFDPAITRDRVAPIMQEGRGVLDLSMNLTPIENITLFFDATNLLGNPIKTYREYDDAGGIFPRARKYLERLYSFGVRFRF